MLASQYYRSPTVIHPAVDQIGREVVSEAVGVGCLARHDAAADLDSGIDSFHLLDVSRGVGGVGVGGMRASVVICFLAIAFIADLPIFEATTVGDVSRKPKTRSIGKLDKPISKLNFAYALATKATNRRPP